MVKRLIVLGLLFSGVIIVAGESEVVSEITSYERESLELVLTTDLSARIKKIEEDLQFWLHEQNQLMEVIKRSGPNEAVMAMMKMIMTHIDSLRTEAMQLFDQLKTAQRLGNTYVSYKN